MLPNQCVNEDFDSQLQPIPEILLVAIVALDANSTLHVIQYYANIGPDK